MWDVLLNWNQEYYQWSWADLAYKARLVSAYFGPFSLLHFAAVPVAVIAVVRREPNRAVLAALYLGWLAQATVIQKTFDYAHYPPTLLGLAVLAMHRWPVGPVFLGWCVAAGFVNESPPDSPWSDEPTPGTPLILSDRPPAPPDRPARPARPSGAAAGPTTRGS